ncbi:hypothetical protein L532_2291 [Bordetella bronchiseptica OSU095]|uniref:hypothetical protein n=1 Tax=Bordetella bronchiseptica TaxID=518 RepID=UPI00049EFF13|nr:hypothetical protein [Bordetella bronchiseptica]KDD44874.1 hypothetical protein L532_2291 [Bordetella bronchiseptica OSU095]
MTTAPAPILFLFRKKPVVVAAVQWFKNGDHPKDYSKTHDGLENGELRKFAPEERRANGWEGDIVRYYRRPDDSGERACQHCGKTMHFHGWIDTLEGGHIVCPGDWIITGVEGEHYPCKPGIFVETYEPVDRIATDSLPIEPVAVAVVRDGKAMFQWQPTFRAMPEGRHDLYLRPRIPADATQVRTGNTADHQEGWFAGVDHGRAEVRASAQNDAQDERPIFEATFGLPTGVQWGGTRYVVDPEYNGSYLANTFVGQWEAWKLRARLAAVHTPQFTISASDRFELTGTVGLLRGYGCAGAADALQRVLDAEMASFSVQGEEAAGDAQELKRKTDLIAELSKIIHNMTVAQQAAWIEWQHGAGAEAGMRWIANGLAGPGHIPEEDEPYGTEAQAYFDANQADPLPACHCGRPSNILHMGNGYCSQEHYAAAIAAQQHKGDE